MATEEQSSGSASAAVPELLQCLPSHPRTGNVTGAASPGLGLPGTQALPIPGALRYSGCSEKLTWGGEKKLKKKKSGLKTWKRPGCLPETAVEINKWKFSSFSVPKDSSAGLITPLMALLLMKELLGIRNCNFIKIERYIFAE